MVKGVLVAALVVFIGLQFVGPARTNPPVTPARTLHAKAPIPGEVHEILSRSCWNCHSNETQWPWYAYLAPISWNVIGHVNEGREHLNFSDWRKSPEEGADLMDEVCTQVKKGKMPIRQYTWMHWRATLTPADVKRLCDWANDTADALMASH
jgi:Haem-binding domain